MILQKEFEKTGNWLFRWRSYLPLVMFVVLLIALFNYDYLFGSEILTAIWNGLCITISFLGLVVRIITIGHTPKGTSGRTTGAPEAETLNTSGIYSTLRHPLYLGNFLNGLGIAMFPHNGWLVLVYILVFWIYYERIMFAEEAFLVRKFGDAYIAWAETTPAIIPAVKNYKKNVLPFSLKTVLKREYSGFFALVLTFFVLKLLSELFAGGDYEIHTAWWMFLLFGFLVWFTLRTLKRKTTWLDVEGR